MNTPAIGRALILVCTALTGASAAHCSRRTVGTAASPVVFLLSRDHAANASPDTLKALAESLRAETGLVVDVRVAKSGVQAIEAFGANQADVGLLKLFEYLLASAEYGVEADLQLVRAGGAATYQGVVVVRAETEFKDARGLAGKRVAYADQYSTSGFVLPAAMFEKAGVKVEFEFAGGHREAQARLKEGKVDAAATFLAAVKGDSSLRVIATTEAVPNEPIFFRRSLDADVKQRIRAALLKLGTTTQVFRELGGVAGFRAVRDDAYDGVAAVIRGAGKTVHALVPDGFAVWESKRWGMSPVP